MSPKRFSQRIANLFPVPARAVLVALAAFIALAAFAGLLPLLAPGPASAVAAPVEEPQTAAGSPAPVVIAATMAATTTTTTILQHTPDPSLVEDPIWVEFQVVPNTVVAVSVDGTIVVTDGTDTCSRTVDSLTSGWPYPNGWRWSCDLYPTTAGAKTLIATFTPLYPAVYATSDNSPGVSHQVNAASAVTITVSASPASPVYGEEVTITATVQPSVCTGIVFFDDGGTEIGRATLDSGTATVKTFSLGAGPHRVKAVYLGSDDCSEAESDVLEMDVAKADTATTISSSDTTPVFGQSLTFTATVTESETVPTPGAGTPTGIVTFQDVFTDAAGTFTTTIGSGALNGDGVAGFTISSLAVGQHTIIATYEGDANFNQSQTSMTFTVDKADTTTGVTHSSSNPSVYGESVTFTAVVSPTLPGAGTPTGNVVFKVDGAAVFTGALGFTNPGEARWVTTPGDSTELDTAPGDRVRDITAEYGGDGNFKPSSSPTFNQTVNPADTTVQLQIPLAETEFGQDVRMSAIVSVNQPGAGTPTGTVIFTVATVPPIVVTDTLPGGGTSVTVVTNTIPVGTWNVVAAYGGDNHFNGSSDDEDHQVNKTDSETTLESSANPSDFGQTLTFTATVEAAGLGLFAPITPTGTVTFTLGTVGVVTRTLDASGIATVVTDTLPAGEHEITAEYGGDGNFKPSEDTLRQTVNKVATTTEISGLSSSAIGDSVTFTATVSETLSGAPVTTGTVDFWDFTTVVYSDTLDVSGQATFTTSSLSAGTHRLKAVYNGTPNFQPSTSQRLVHTVSAAGTTTTLAVPASSVFGQTVTFTATVTAGVTPVTSGQVTFYDGATTLGSDTLDASGEATLSTSTLAAGAHTIKARFGGNADYGPSEDTKSYTVDQANTTTSITSDDPDSSVVGQPVLVEFTVEAVSPGSGTPTGDVTVDDGTGASCTGTVADGDCTLIPTTAGLKTLTANYAGNSNFIGSSDNTQTHQVNPAGTTTTVTSSPPSSLPGDSVTITALVTAVAPGSGTPTGNVTFRDGGTPICSNVLLSGGSATCNTTALALGLHTLWADYLGDGNFSISSGSTTHNVSAIPADLSVTKTDSPDPVNVGENVTYIIAVANHGPESTDVTLTDTLPPEVTFVSATPSQGSCPTTPNVGDPGGTVTCELGNLTGGTGSATVTIVVNVPLTTPAGTVLRNTAQVIGTRPEPVPDPHLNTSIAETTVYRSPRRGDCNGDYAVDLADVWAIVRDIFDPTFQGTSGCDANKDQQVDAGDVPSTVLIMLNGLNAGGMGGDLNAATEGPALTLPDQVPAVPSGLVTLPVSFAANGHSITSLAFSVDYDETWLALDPTDRDGNGIPDAVIFSLPGDFTYSVTFDGDDADGEVDIFIGDISPPLTSLSDGPIVFMILNVDSSSGSTQGAVRFSLDPAASFGDTSGQSVPGTAMPTGRYPYQIYLPVLH